MPVCRHKSNKWLFFFSFESTLGSKFHAFRFLSASPRWGSQTKPLLKALWFLVDHLLSKQTRARNAASLHFPQCASRNLRSVGRVNGTSKRLATLIRYKQLLCDAWNLQKRARYQNSGAKTEKKSCYKKHNVETERALENLLWRHCCKCVMSVRGEKTQHAQVTL